MNTEPSYDEQPLNAAADAWSAAVKAACSTRPSPQVIARIHNLAAQGLRARRGSAFFRRVRPFLVPAAAAAAFCAATWVAVRPTPASVPAHPFAALDGMLLLAAAADSLPAAAGDDANGTDAASLARRLLELQGFIDSETETLLTYL